MTLASGQANRSTNPRRRPLFSAASALANNASASASANSRRRSNRIAKIDVADPLLAAQVATKDDHFPDALWPGLIAIDNSDSDQELFQQSVSICA